MSPENKKKEEGVKPPAAAPPAPGPSTALAQAPTSPETTLAAVLSGQAVETGFEDASSADFVMPMLKLLQKMSPEVEPTHAKYMAAAKPGQFLDVSKQELMDEVRIIPCLFKPQMVEWKPDRGGYVSSHDPGFEAGLPRNEKGQFIMENGNVLVDTKYFYCLRVMADGGLTPVIISLQSTELKHARDWMTAMSNRKLDGPTGRFTPPIYLNVCKITPKSETKGKDSWFSWHIELERLINEKEAAILEQAMDARKSFQQTAAKMRPVEAEYEAPAASDANKHLG